MHAWRTDEDAVSLLGNVSGGEGCYDELVGWLLGRTGRISRSAYVMVRGPTGGASGSDVAET